jgi:hypothetical protein
MPDLETAGIFDAIHQSIVCFENHFPYVVGCTGIRGTITESLPLGQGQFAKTPAEFGRNDAPHCVHSCHISDKKLV